MSTYVSPFKGLPKASELRALAFPNGRPQSFPFQQDLRNLCSSFEKQYLSAVLRCLDEGHAKSSRPGQNTLMLDDVQFTVDISGGQIPLLSTKFVPYKSFLIENLWFISGSTDVAFLKQNGVSIWDEWVIPETARFENADKYTGGEILNWVRCVRGAEAYKEWREYQRDNNIGRPTAEEVLAWWAKSKAAADYQATPPMVKLVSGSIGDGAYGAQWRRRVDTHLDYQLDPIDDQPGDVGAQYMAKFPTYGCVGSYKRPISRNGAIGSETVAVLQSTYDQLGDVIKMLRESPDSRRIIMDAWDPAKVKDCALPPCHPWTQFTSHLNEETGKRELTIKFTMRSL